MNSQSLIHELGKHISDARVLFESTPKMNLGWIADLDKGDFVDRFEPIDLKIAACLELLECPMKRLDPPDALDSSLKCIGRTNLQFQVEIIDCRLREVLKIPSLVWTAFTFYFDEWLNRADYSYELAQRKWAMEIGEPDPLYLGLLVGENRRLTREGYEHEIPITDKRLELLQILIAARGTQSDKDELMDLLYPDKDSSSALHKLKDGLRSDIRALDLKITGKWQLLDVKLSSNSTTVE